MIRIVIVEDEALVKKGLRLTTDWQGFGCEVVGEASNGFEGIEVITRLKPDIVITDIRMPGLDGLQMIEALTGRADAEYIIISGYSEFEYARQAVRFGVKDYLIKPINDDELADAIQKACGAVRNKKKLIRIESGMEGIADSKVMLFKEYFSEGARTGRSYYVEKMIKYISDNYQKNINVRDVAESLSMSESHISRLFKSEVGHTFVDYLTYYRIKKAIGYLKDPDVKIYEIAEKIGYRDQRYFSVIFKKLVGVTPTEFREQLNA
jgi:two-component system response regulator YesN